MNDPTNDHLEELFTAALREPPDRRAAFLRDRCNGDERLIARVGALLRAHEDGAAFLGEPDVATRPAGDLPDGGMVGRYHIRWKIATGGMGAVYEAVQEQPHRSVALKIMRRGIASRSALRRFEYESQILARLRHPNIAQVYEAGTHDDGSGGVPFFAMEYIPGARTLTDYAGDRKLDARARLETFVKVCDAVQHGHQKGIIHRDLKPSNILVDAEGEPKIIDFGVARATDSDVAITTLQTDVGQLIGTLQYMSPEQCAADPHDLDSRSDVYALGVVLFELLCGDLPYDVSGVPVVEAVRLIRDQTPTRLSATNRTLRGDLETIVLKALDKDRTRRYQSAADLAADIERYMHDQPIVARPPSTMYQLRKFARRNKLLVSGAATLIVVLAAATVVSMSFWRAAAASARRAHAAALFSLGQLQQDRTEALAYLLASLEHADNDATRRLILENLWKGPTEFRLAPAHCYWSIDFSPDGRWLAVENERAFSEPYKQKGGMLWPSDGGPPTKLEGAGLGMNIRVGPHSDVAVQSIGMDRRKIRIWSLPDGRLLRELSFDGNTRFDISGDGQRLFTYTQSKAGEDHEQTIQSWPIDGGEPEFLGRVRGDTWAGSCAVDPTGTRFAWGDGRNVFVAPLGGDPERLMPSPPLEHNGYVSGIAFDRSGTVLATSGGSETKLWSVTADRIALLNTLLLPGGHGMRFNESVSILARGDRLKRLDAPPDASPLPIDGRGKAVAIHPSGRWLATGAPDENKSTVSLWSLSHLYPRVLSGYSDHESVYGLAFDPNGDWIASAGVQSVRIWPLHVESGELSAALYVTDGPAIWPSRVVADPEGEFVVALFLSGMARILPLDGGAVRELEGFTDQMWALAIGPKGRLIAAGAGNFRPEEAVIRVWDLGTDSVRTLDPANGKLIDGLEFTPDGDLLSSSAGTLRRWTIDAGTHEVLEHIPVTVANHETGRSFDLSPDGSQLLAVHEGTLSVHKLAAGTSQPLSTHGEKVVTAIFDRTGDVVVSTDEDGIVRVGPVSGEEPHLLLGQSAFIGALAVSPDGEWIATGSAKTGTIFLWPMPDVASTPLHLLPRRALIDKLKSLTNLRVVWDESAASGWKLVTGPFPGWEKAPTW